MSRRRNTAHMPTWYSNFSTALLRQRALSRRRELGAPLHSSACSLSFWFLVQTKGFVNATQRREQEGDKNPVGYVLGCMPAGLPHQC